MRKACNVGMVLLCAAPLALAQGGGAQRNGAPAIIDGRVFQRLDANGDGRLTREEARIDPAVSGAFDRIDSNGDGVITREEARRFDEKRDVDGEARDPARDGKSGPASAPGSASSTSSSGGSSSAR